VLVLLAGLVLSGAGQASERFGLVIGNAAYEVVPALANPGRDAEAVGKVLRDAGFDTTIVRDSGLTALRRAVDDFLRKLQGARPDAVVVIFYAGHAVQVEGVNLLLPIDARLARDQPIAPNAVSLNDILRRLDATRVGSKIIVLDACRDNPLVPADAMAPRGLGVVDTSLAPPAGNREAGLARIESKGGTLVAFSTSPGAAAFDGGGENSPFTTAFVRIAREPGLPVEQVFRQVRVAVHESTAGRQTPWESSSLVANVALFDPGAKDIPVASRTSVGPGGSTTVPVQPNSGQRGIVQRPTRETFAPLSLPDAYRIAIEWDDPQTYRLFLDRYPESQEALRIHRLLTLRQETVAWASTIRDGSAEAFEDYLKAFQGSQFTAAAQRLVRQAPRRQALASALVCTPQNNRVNPRQTVPTPRRAATERPAPRRAVARDEDDDAPVIRRAAPPRAVPATPSGRAPSRDVDLNWDTRPISPEVLNRRPGARPQGPSGTQTLPLSGDGRGDGGSEGGRGQR
jgi:uncharacterized caspase-like protein